MPSFGNEIRMAVVLTTIRDITAYLQTEQAFFGAADVIVVGDVATPRISEKTSATFISIEDQRDLPFRLAKLLPERHYCRKNIGYLIALSRGANVIYDVDDDTWCLPDWTCPDFGCGRSTSSDGEFLNIHRLFATEISWPRGFPLPFIHTAEPTLRECSRRQIGVWQGLVAHDPDVDAIFRLTRPALIFDRACPPVSIDQGRFCPFNSQSTFWCASAFDLMYLPTTVSFRFTDVLRSYVTQRVLWERDLHVGFAAPWSHQERNQHDLMEDFIQEVEMHIALPRLPQLLQTTADLKQAYAALREHGIVAARELEGVAAWCDDVAMARELGEQCSGSC